MHDNLILPIEPVGVLGAKPNVDLGNVPIMVSPLELLDGCIHALTCICLLYTSDAATRWSV